MLVGGYRSTSYKCKPEASVERHTYCARLLTQKTSADPQAEALMWDIMLKSCYGCGTQHYAALCRDADKLISFTRFPDSLFCSALCGHVYKHLPALAVALCLKRCQLEPAGRCIRRHLNY